MNSSQSRTINTTRRRDFRATDSCCRLDPSPDVARLLPPAPSPTRELLPSSFPARRRQCALPPRSAKLVAIKWCTRFADLWQDGDPELLPQVDEARARLAALQK